MASKHGVIKLTIRLCIDPKPLKKALLRNDYPTPMIDDLLPDLSKARIFSIADTKIVSGMFSQLMPVVTLFPSVHHGVIIAGYGYLLVFPLRLKNFSAG